MIKVANAKPKSPVARTRAVQSQVSRSPKVGHFGKVDAKSNYIAPPLKRTPTGASKLSSVIAMLRDKHGASIERLVKATGWQAHSVRGAISGAIKKKLGLKVTSDRVDGQRIYRIVK